MATREGKHGSSGDRSPAPPILVAEAEGGELFGLVHDLGFEAIRATDGLAALDELDRRRYELVLVDRESLPELDGDSVLEAIRMRQRAGSWRTRVVGFQSRPAGGHEPPSYDEVAARPFDRAILCELLERWLGEDADRRVTESTVEVLEREVFEATCESLRRFDLLERCLDELLRPVWIGRFAAANPPPESSDVAEAAHKLKGSALQFGATRLSLACADLESRAKTQASLSLQEDLRVLRAEIAQVAEEIRALS